MQGYALVALGGALGSVARAGLGAAMVRATGAGFPWGTLLINGVGSLAIGWFARLPAGADARAFVMVGLCGGFTTFSAFSLQTLDLARTGRPGLAVGNVGLSLLVCLSAVAAGGALAGLFGRS